MSYAEEVYPLAQWWQQQGMPDWVDHRQRVLALLGEQARLERMARIVGKDALPPRQQLTLLCTEVVNDGFLYQSSFSPVDRYCSPARQARMMALLMHFIDVAGAAVDRGVSVDDIGALPLLRQLRGMAGSLEPEQRESEVSISTLPLAAPSD